MENNEARLVRGALVEADIGRAAAGAKVGAPWWYYPLVGLIFAGNGVVFALGNALAQLGALVVLLAAGRYLNWAYRSVTGISISGLRGGVSTVWSMVWIVVTVGFIVSGWLFAERLNQQWPIWVMAIVIVVETLAYGRVFELAVRTQLRSPLTTPPS